MRFAYLILAHKDLDQLGALIARLLRDGPDDRVVLHFDRGSPLADADLAVFAGRFDGAVALTPRIRSRWGHHSLVEAEWLLMRRASELTYDHAHLLSGQDWPVVDRAAIVAGVEPGACHLSLEAPAMAERMNSYHLHDRLIGPGAHATSLRYHLSRSLRGAGDLLTRIAGPRACPFGPDWRKGSQWWSLPRAAVDHALPLVGGLIRSGRLRHTLCADEHVIQTILARSPFADRLTDNRRFIRWSPGSSNPDWLRAGDEPTMRASGAWFARKVDRAVDPFFLRL